MMAYPSYEELMVRNRAAFIATLAEVESVKFFSFVDIEDYPWISEQAEVVIDKIAYRASHEEMLQWLKHILLAKKIAGRYIFAFMDKAHPYPMPFALVDLSPFYEWVEPLWKLGHVFAFLSTESRMYLTIQLSEGFYEAAIKYSY